MKKNILIIILIVYSSCYSYSQTNKSEINIFYETAIKNYIDYFKDAEKRGVLVPRDLYLIAEDIPKIYLPKKINGYTINYIDIYNKKNKKLLRKRIWAISIKPLRLNGNKASVSLIDFSISYNKNGYEFSNGGGSKTAFEYDCNEGKWKFLNTECHGI